MSLITKLAFGAKFTDVDLENELSDICDRVHSTCDSQCPVYAVNDGVPASFNFTATPCKTRKACACYKNGEAMLAFLRQYAAFLRQYAARK